jgi:hypothetical protein
MLPVTLGSPPVSPRLAGCHVPLDRRGRMGAPALLARGWVKSTGDDQPPRLGNKLVPSRTFVREQLANFSDCLHERIVRVVWVTAGQMPVALRQRVREIVVYPSAQP